MSQVLKCFVMNLIVISSSVGNLGYRIMRNEFHFRYYVTADDVTADPRSHYLSRHLVLFLLFFIPSSC